MREPDDYTDEEKRVFWEAFERADARLVDPEKAGEDALRRHRVRVVP